MGSLYDILLLKVIYIYIISYTSGKHPYDNQKIKINIQSVRLNDVIIETTIKWIEKSDQN